MRAFSDKDTGHAGEDLHAAIRAMGGARERESVPPRSVRGYSIGIILESAAVRRTGRLPLALIGGADGEGEQVHEDQLSKDPWRGSGLPRGLAIGFCLMPPLETVVAEMYPGSSKEAPCIDSTAISSRTRLMNLFDIRHKLESHEFGTLLQAILLSDLATRERLQRSDQARNDLLWVTLKVKALDFAALDGQCDWLRSPVEWDKSGNRRGQPDAACRRYRHYILWPLFPYRKAGGSATS